MGKQNSQSQNENPASVKDVVEKKIDINQEVAAFEKSIKGSENTEETLAPKTPEENAASVVSEGSSVTVTETVKEKTPVASEPTQVSVQAPVKEVFTDGFFAYQEKPIPPQFQETIPLVELQIKETLETYVRDMAPRKIVSDGKINENQVRLYRAITQAINSPEVNFVRAFTNLLEFFENHKDGAFHEDRIFRGLENLTLQLSEITAFQRLINMIKATCNKKSRALAVKQIDFVATLQFGVTEQGRNRIFAFYNI